MKLGLGASQLYLIVRSSNNINLGRLAVDRHESRPAGDKTPCCWRRPPQKNRKIFGGERLSRPRPAAAGAQVNATRRVLPDVIALEDVGLQL